MSLVLTVGNWWECSGDELWEMSLRQSNFVADGDKYNRRGGNQALNKIAGLRCTTLLKGDSSTDGLDCHRLVHRVF